MSILAWILITLVASFIVGLVAGLILLCMDRHRKRSSRTLNLKDGITLEYDCTPPGIYERLRAFLEDR